MACVIHVLRRKGYKRVSGLVPQSARRSFFCCYTSFCNPIFQTSAYLRYQYLDLPRAPAMLARLFVVAASLLSQATAITIPIAVGRFNLTFDPSTIKVAPGDVLEFRFWARNHSVVQGTWDKACSPIAEGGFFSGFFPTQPGGPNVGLPPFFFLLLFQSVIIFTQVQDLTPPPE